MRIFPRPTWWLLTGALSLLGGALLPASAAAEQPVRVYLGVDKAQILDLGAPARKVAVVNPNIADVQVINPLQVLLTGKAVGVTSLVVFSAQSRQFFDLVVHPAPVGGASVSTGSGPYTVRVQRGDKVSEQFFARDGEQHWLELGQARLETDAGRK